MTSASTALPEYNIVMIQLDELRPTEEINLDRAMSLSKVISCGSVWTRPLLVELKHSLVMDGHHRLHCARHLSLRKVPCIQLSYEDPRLSVTSWEDEASFDTKKIYEAGLSGKLLGFKSTRHRLEPQIPACVIALDALM